MSLTTSSDSYLENKSMKIKSSGVKIKKVLTHPQSFAVIEQMCCCFSHRRHNEIKLKSCKDIFIDKNPFGLSVFDLSASRVYYKLRRQVLTPQRQFAAPFKAAYF
jgi:hypothetical protein